MTVVRTKLSLAPRRQLGFAKLWIVISLWTKLLASPLDLGLCLAHFGFSDVDLLGGLILPGFGIDSLGDKLSDSVSLFADIVA